MYNATYFPDFLNLNLNRIPPENLLEFNVCTCTYRIVQCIFVNHRGDGECDHGDFLTNNDCDRGIPQTTETMKSTTGLQSRTMEHRREK